MYLFIYISFLKKKSNIQNIQHLLSNWSLKMHKWSKNIFFSRNIRFYKFNYFNKYIYKKKFYINFYYLHTCLNKNLKLIACFLQTL